jgi:hypothetical protein
MFHRGEFLSSGPPSSNGQDVIAPILFSSPSRDDAAHVAEESP